MKKQSRIFRALMGAILLFGVTAFVSGTANAEWHSIHGTSAQIQDTSILTKYARYAQGLDFYQKPGYENWVHFAIPSIGSPKTVRKIDLICDLGINSKITRTAVYYGHKKVFEKQLDWKGSGSGKVRRGKITLDKAHEFKYGLGISFCTYVLRNATGSPDWFRFISASANFQ